MEKPDTRLGRKILDAIINRNKVTLYEASLAANIPPTNGKIYRIAPYLIRYGILKPINNFGNTKIFKVDKAEIDRFVMTELDLFNYYKTRVWSGKVMTIRPLSRKDI